MKRSFIFIMLSSCIAMHASEKKSKNIRDDFESVKSLNDHQIKSDSILNKITDETISVLSAEMTILEDQLCAFEHIANNNERNLAQQIASHMFNVHATVYLKKVAHELEQENISIASLGNRLRTLHRIENRITEQDKIKTASELYSRCLTLYVKKSSEITNISIKE